MRIVFLLVLLVGLTVAQKKKDEAEYDDDYEYEADPLPAKDAAATPAKKDLKDSKKQADAVSTSDTEGKSTTDEDEEDVKAKNKKVEHPTSIFLKPRNNRAHGKLVTPSPGNGRLRPTLPSFIKHPATGGQVSTTVTPRPPGAPRAERSTAAPIKARASNSKSTTTTTTQKPKRGGSSSTASSSNRDSKKSARTTEAPVASKEGRKFGGTVSASKNKPGKPSRFNKERDNTQ